MATALLIAVTLVALNRVIPPLVDLGIGIFALPFSAAIAVLYVMAKRPRSSKAMLVGYFMLTLLLLIGGAFVVGGLTGNLDF